MQEREIIYKILFSSVAPYLLITANLIIVVCIIKILWITVKNKSKKISSETIAFSCVCQFFYYIRDRREFCVKVNNRLPFKQ